MYITVSNMPKENITFIGHYKALVVDDARAILAIMDQLISISGGRAYIAATEKQAMALSDKHEFDIVILDHILEETTGLELLLKLRGRRPLLKTILISGSFHPSEEEIKSYKLSAFLKKPFDLAEMIMAVKNTLGR